MYSDTHMRTFCSKCSEANAEIDKLKSEKDALSTTLQKQQLAVEEITKNYEDLQVSLPPFLSLCKIDIMYILLIFASNTNLRIHTILMTLCQTTHKLREDSCKRLADSLADAQDERKTLTESLAACTAVAETHSEVFAIRIDVCDTTCSLLSIDKKFNEIYCESILDCSIFDTIRLCCSSFAVEFLFFSIFFFLFCVVSNAGL